MTKKILEFRARALEKCPAGDFYKALTAVKILMDYTAEESLMLIDIWVARGFLSTNERADLYNFYGWMISHD